MLRSRSVQAFAAVLAAAALLRFYVPGPPALYWSVTLLVAALVAAGARTPASDRSVEPAIQSGFLCDRCKYNDVRYCSRPERPNATHCDEFKRQGS